MNYAGFIGQSYTSSSPAVDCERSMNLYPEVVNAAGVTAKSRMVLRRRPGYSLLQTVPDSPGRGKFAIDGRAFLVAGGSFFELLSPTTYALRGTFPTGVSAVQMKCNTVQVLLLADGLLYCFTLATNTFVAVTGQNGLPAYVVSIASVDTYFLALGQNSTEFALSALLDGTTWSGLDFGSSQEPDNAVAIEECHLYLWVFGQNEIVLFQDTGAANFPFQRVAGSQIEQGLAAVNSVAKADNTLLWLGGDPGGGGVFYRADGQLPTRISTHAVEAAIQKYSTIADAVSSVYQEEGHLFCQWHFPTAKATWSYDVSSGMWHERGYFNAATGSYSADLGRYLSYCFGTHLVADFSSGKVYAMSLAYANDNGSPIRWLRAAPHIAQETEWLFYSYFILDMQVGDGLPAGATPQVMIRWSDDGGRTWRTPRQASCGKTGEYALRVKINRLGRSRNRVFEVSGTDAIPVLALIAAYLGLGA